MRKYMRAASISLLLWTTPLQAQSTGIAPPNGLGGPTAMGGFVGARVRIPLGGAQGGDKQVRASLTVARCSAAKTSDGRRPRGASAKGWNSDSPAIAVRRIFRWQGKA